MGITGLLPFLKKIHTPVNIGQFEGCTVAIDAYCWLHKGAFSCAEKLAMGEKTDQYVYYCMKYVENLLKKNIKPILVFDGCHLPSKKDVETSRREKRDMYKKKAAALLREGNRAEARECLRRCVDITPTMALQLMNVCRERGVDCIVAPYEADAQLAYLNKCGIAQLIITEDSDLLLFGCEKVIFKMDFFGNGILIERSKLNEVVQIQNGFYTFEKFRYMCIMSGCDYLSSIQGIGLVKACKVFKTARNPDLRQVLKKMSTYLNMNLTVTPDYIEGFMKADNTFLYQLCFDTKSRKLVPLNPYPADVKKEELKYAGVYMSENKALQIALGNINIYSGEMFAHFDPDTFVPRKASKKKRDELHMLSIWDKNYRIQPRISNHQAARDTERPSLKNKEVIINAKLIKKSPQKRIRSEESEKYSDSDLSDIYSNRPVCKKFRTSTEGDANGKPVFIATPLFKISPLRQKEVVDDEDPPPPIQKQTEFFESLKDATESAEKSDDVAVSPFKEDKENSAVSPLNRFAVASPMKKERFNINAKRESATSKHFTRSPAKRSTQTLKSSKFPPKNIFSLAAQKKTGKFNVNTITEVKSRYFGSQESKCLSKTEFVNTCSKNETVSDSPAVHNNCSETDMFTEPNNDSACQASVLDTLRHQSSNVSPASAFSWSRFKFLKNSSETKDSPNNPINKQFKSVISEKTRRKHTADEESKKSITDLFKKGSASPKSIDYTEFMNEQCDSSQKSDTTLSQTSNLYSIDSDCMPDTQDLARSLNSDCDQDIDDTDKDIDIGTSKLGGNDGNEVVKSYLKEEVDLADDCIITNCSSAMMNEMVNTETRLDIHKKKTNSSMSHFASSKSGCRISGLSKKKTKSTLKDVNQKSIKDMLSRFALKGTAEKLDHHTPLKNAAADDVEIVAITPVSR